MPPNTSGTKALLKKDPLAKLAFDALEDLKGQDITVLDVQSLTAVTDVMIICTGTSNRHVKALAQNVAEDAKHAGHRPLGIEGTDQGEWVLVDLGGVVVHVMQAQARAFYQLEKLWTPPEPSSDEVAVAKPRKAAVRKPKAEGAAPKKSAAKPARKSAKSGAASAGKSADKKTAKKKAFKRASGQHLGGSGARKPASKSASRKKS